MPVEVANTISSVGIFFAGLGLFFYGCAFWGIFRYTQIRTIAQVHYIQCSQASTVWITGKAMSESLVALS